jgi:hypothetical protein
MKQQWEKVNQNIAVDDLGKHDWTAPISQIRMNGEGRIGLLGFQAGSEGQIGMNHRGVVPNDHALGQLSNRVGIPTRYSRKCAEKGKTDLLAANFNTWIKDLDEDTEGDKQWFLRGKNDMLRGVLTDKYSQLDNSFVFEALSNSLQNGDVVDVKNFDLTSKYLNFRMVFPDLNVNIGTTIKPDNVMVGIHVTNSEVGASSLRIDSCLFRLVCTNGLIAKVGGESLMQQRHVHLTSREMENRVADAIDKALQMGDSVVDRFARSREIAVIDPMKTLERLARSQKYSNDFVDNLKNSFNTEPDPSAFGIINAFTHASQSLPFERRLEVETYAGKVMDDFLKTNTRNISPLDIDDDIWS